MISQHKISTSHLAVFVSLLFSLWCIATDSVVNSDGILYLETARYFSQGNWTAAYQHYNWPFYSALIAGLSAVTPLSLEYAAYVINIVFLCMMTYVFLAILRELQASEQVCIAAALLLLTNVSLNEYRDYVVRDFGYWALYLLAIWNMLRFNNSGRIRYALGWNLAILSASLFRIEGLVFMLLAPLILLFTETRSQRRGSAILLCYLLTLVVALIVFAWVMITDAGIAQLGRLFEPLQKLQEIFVSMQVTIPQKADQLATTILNHYSDSYAIYGIWATLLIILLIKIVDMTGMLALACVVTFTLSRKLRQQLPQQTIITGFIIINLLVVGFFLVANFFLVGRFVVPLALLLLIPAAYGLSYLYRWAGWQTHRALFRPSVLKSFLALILLAMLVDGLVSFGSSKRYIRDAADWVLQNVPAEATLYSNNMPMYYYSGRWADHQALSHARDMIDAGSLDKDILHRYRYVALKVGRKQQQLRRQLQEMLPTQLVYESTNERGDQVLIFQINL